MSRIIRDFDSIRDVLLASIGNRVTIILSSGRILRVVVEAVVDNLLIASSDDRIITININRIDAVVALCRQLFEAVLDRRRSRGSDPVLESSRSRETLGIVDDVNSRSTDSRIIGDAGSRSRSRSRDLGVSADLSDSRGLQSRGYEYFDSSRAYELNRLNGTDNSSSCGYISHRENLARFFY